MSAYMNILAGVTEQARKRAEREADILNQREKEAKAEEVTETVEELKEQLKALEKATVEVTEKLKKAGAK
ncbi:hypothetical protein MHB40_22165 [Lysinibacillus sp. FSL K6-0057]|uniref:hypothetical protein n=1 Tax=Lysinibacillus sp. FSL K6-0057 TaxID=2921411 RepID=UPI00315A1C03